jgi:hypothetical protein
MLKLTLCEDENRAVYIRASRILSLVRGLADKGTHVKIDHAEHWVTETPEQIMAMPEMVGELYPRVTVMPPLSASPSPYFTTSYGVTT